MVNAAEVAAGTPLAATQKLVRANGYEPAALDPNSYGSYLASAYVLNAAEINAGSKPPTELGVDDTYPSGYRNWYIIACPQTCGDRRSVKRKFMLSNIFYNKVR